MWFRHIETTKQQPENPMKRIYRYMMAAALLLLSGGPVQAADLQVGPGESLADAVRRAREMRRLGEADAVTIHLAAPRTRG